MESKKHNTDRQTDRQTTSVGGLRAELIWAPPRGVRRKWACGVQLPALVARLVVRLLDHSFLRGPLTPFLFKLGLQSRLRAVLVTGFSQVFYFLFYLLIWVLVKY